VPAHYVISLRLLSFCFK